MLVRQYLKWEEVDQLWQNVNQHWEDIFIEIETAVRKGGGDYAAYVKGNPWDKLRKDIGEEKTKKVIKLYCKVNNIEYQKIVEGGKDIKVTVNEFERFVKNGISIKVGNLDPNFTELYESILTEWSNENGGINSNEDYKTANIYVAKKIWEKTKNGEL